MDKEAKAYREEHGTFAGYEKADSKILIFFSSPAKEGAMMGTIKDGKVTEWSKFEESGYGPGPDCNFSGLWRRMAAPQN